MFLKMQRFQSNIFRCFRWILHDLDTARSPRGVAKHELLQRWLVVASGGGELNRPPRPAEMVRRSHATGGEQKL